MSRFAVDDNFVCAFADILLNSFLFVQLLAELVEIGDLQVGA